MLLQDERKAREADRSQQACLKRSLQECQASLASTARKLVQVQTDKDALNDKLKNRESDLNTMKRALVMLGVDSNLDSKRMKH